MLHKQMAYHANDLYLNTDFNTIKGLIVKKLTKPKYEVLQDSNNILAIKKGQCIIRVNSIGNVEVFSNESDHVCNDSAEIKVIQDAFKTKIPEFEIIDKNTEDMCLKINGMPIKVVAAPSSFAGIKYGQEDMAACTATMIANTSKHAGERKSLKSRRNPFKNKNTFKACTDIDHLK